MKPFKAHFFIVRPLAFFAASTLLVNSALASQTPQFAANDSSYVYATLGTTAYFADFPKYESDIVNNANNQSIQSKRFNGVYPSYQVGIGYHFAHNTLLPSIFGDATNLEFDYSYLQNGQTNYSGFNDLIDILSIEGGTVGIDSTPLETRLKSSLNQQGFLFLWQGNKWLGAHVLSHPNIGPHFVENHQKYTTYSSYETFGAEDADNESTSLRTSYTGLQLGDSFEYVNVSRFTPNAGLNINIYHPYSSLSAMQQSSAVLAPNGILNVNNNKTTFAAYELSPSIGVKYAFTAKPTSPSLALTAGLDYWSWVPKIVAPGLDVGQEIHISHQTMLDKTVGLELTVPLA